MKAAPSPQNTLATRYEDILRAPRLKAIAAVMIPIIDVHDRRDSLRDLLSHASVVCCTMVGRGLSGIMNGFEPNR